VERYLPWSRTARLVVRALLAVLCFVIAIVLTVAPGPAFVFWIAGFVLLGFSVGQILLSVHAVQEWVRPRVPYGDRLPRLRKAPDPPHDAARWVRMIDSFSGHREKRARRSAPRRGALGILPPVSRREG